MVYHREWHYDAQTGDIVESTCCPCLVYGRTNLRLKIASDMRDGRNMKAAADSFQESTPIFPLLSSACCAFAFCLPFYGCFISSLRGRVRDFYDIDGTNGEDLAEGCFCPVETLILTEHEIILREERTRNPSKATSDSSGYVPNPPLTSSSSSSSTSQATTPNTECDEPLPCIPEEYSTTTPSSMSSRRTSASRRRERSIARDPVAPTDATLVNAHELSQDPTTPAMYKGHSAPHRLSKDPTSLTHASPSHRLSKDPATLTHPPPTHHFRDDNKTQVTSTRADTRSSRHKGHGSKHDQVDSFRPRRASDTGHDLHHDLHHDPAVRVEHPAPAAHALQDDVNTSPRKSSPSNAHHLQHDAVDSRAKSPRPHTLETDESVPSRSAGPGPHHLQHDM